MLTVERSLNVYTAGIPQIINLSQYDDDFKLVFALYTSEGEFTMPTGTTAEIMGTKTDGNGYSASGVIVGNTVTITGNVQMTACAGRNIFEIVLRNSGKRLATINFILQIERAALDADTIQSETVLKELDAIIDGADRAEAAAERAENAAETIDETVAELKEDISRKAPVIINASDDAEVVTFNDGADDMPMKSVVLKLVPHQEGTGDPSPDNVRPISGYTAVNVRKRGKNLLIITATDRTYNGITIKVNDDGTIEMNGTATATAAFYLSTLTDQFAKGKYILSGCPSGGSGGTYSLRMYAGSSGIAYDYGDGVTWDGRLNVRVGIVIGNGQTVNNLIFKPMIRHASVADDTFEPFVSSTTYSATLPQTVYGGTLDVVSGELAVTHSVGIMKRSTSWKASTNYPGSFYVNSDGMFNSISGFRAKDNTPFACSHAKTVTKLSNFVKGTCYCDNSINIRILDAGATVEDWNSFLDEQIEAGTPVLVCAERRYPITLTLTPQEVTTLLGSNTIWMDADGTIQCDYPADTKLYIDALTAPDDDMIADSNIASGKYFTVNNRLYISTSAIAQGEAIVVGTNCAQTDLATALNIIKEA